VQRQQRKSDVMMSFGLTTCSAVYYQVPHSALMLAFYTNACEIGTTCRKSSSMDTLQERLRYLALNKTNRMLFHVMNSSETDCKFN
jgi:hypothetical protein